MANKFTLRGYQIEVDYTVGGDPSFPALTFRRGPVSKSFKPAEIRTEAITLGALVSVPLMKAVDTGGETFAFIVPQIDAPQGQTHFTTAAVLERFSGPDSVPPRPPSWEAHVLEGTAQTVIVPL